MPIEYYAARDMESDKNLPRDSAIKRYRNSLYFVVSISGENAQNGSALLQRGSGMPGFSENVTRNSFQREQDVFLFKGADTIRPGNFNYERNWGIGNEDVFVASFPRKELQKQVSTYHFIFRDIAPELGTIDIALKELMKHCTKLKG